MSCKVCSLVRSGRPSAPCSMPGFYVELVSLITNRLGLHAKFTGVKDTEFEPYINSSQNGIVAMDVVLELLKNETYDLITFFFDNSDSFGDGFEVSSTIYFSTTKYVMAPVQSMSGMFSFFKVYNIFVWLAIFCTFILIALIGYLIFQLAPRIAINDRRSLGNLIWQLFRLKLRQNDEVRERLISFKILLFIFALLNCGILIQIYTGLITSQAVRPVYPYPFKPAEIYDVLREKSFSLILQSKYYWWYKSIMNSTASPFFELRDAIKDNPIRLAADESKDPDVNKYIMEKVQQGSWIAIQTNEIITISKYNGHCNFVTFDTKHLMMRKGHPLLPAINKVIDEETIKIRRLHEKYYNHKRPTSCEEAKIGPRALGLTPYLGIFILLLVGFGISICAFVVEIRVKRD